MMAGLIDNGIDGRGSMSYILRAGLLLVAMALAALLFGALSGKCAARASAGLARNLRKDIYYHVQTFSFANIDHFSTRGHRHAADHRRHQRTECVPDAHSRRGAQSADAGLCPVHGVSHQRGCR